MKIIITIDTEEDNWARYSAMENPVENIQRVVTLQRIFDEFGARPTYLISYPVATNPKSIKILKKVLDEGKCEIGMHCHPWNTPPLDEKEEIVGYNTMLCNLPEELQCNKLAVLHDVICKNFGIRPVSFRAGRWGFGPAVSRFLSQLGYRIDTSVSPYIDWTDYHGPDYSAFGPEPFRFKAEGLMYKDETGTLLQVPASIGFLQSNFQLCQRIVTGVENYLGRKLHIIGLLDRIRVLNKVWFSPETADADSMIRLSKRMKKNGYPCLNMFFHSTSLVSGLSPFVKSVKDENDFLFNIKGVLDFARSSKWEFQTLSQFEKGF